MKVEIGKLAGKIWHFLKDHGRTDINVVKKNVLETIDSQGTNITFFSSVGWLLKEDKINLSEAREGETLKTYISLK